MCSDGLLGHLEESFNYLFFGIVNVSQRAFEKFLKRVHGFFLENKIWPLTGTVAFSLERLRPVSMRSLNSAV